MRTKLLVILGSLALIVQAMGAPVAPTWIDTVIIGDSVSLKWTHPDCYLFNVREVKPAEAKATVHQVFFNGVKSNGGHEFKWQKRFSGGRTNVYAIQAVSEQGVASTWSGDMTVIAPLEVQIIPMTVKELPAQIRPIPSRNVRQLVATNNAPSAARFQQALAAVKKPAVDVLSYPPSPLDKRYRVSWADTATATNAWIVPDQNYILLWDYDGEIIPELRFRVYESTDLKTWTVLTNQPVARKNDFVLTGRPFAFYKVSTLNIDVPGVESWNSTTNLVMDP